MEPQLESLREQFRAIREESASLTAGLSDAQLLWRPAPKAWSIAECFAHLNLVDGMDVAQFFKVIQAGRKEGRTSTGPFRWNWFERWFIRALDNPKPGLVKVKAPKIYSPAAAAHIAPRETLLEFERLHHDLHFMLGEADGLDLKGIKVIPPFAKWLKLALGARLDMLAAHDRKHIRQATRVRDLAEFPQK
jgi:hypothetical protein